MSNITLNNKIKIPNILINNMITRVLTLDGIYINPDIILPDSPNIKWRRYPTVDTARISWISYN